MKTRLNLQSSRGSVLVVGLLILVVGTVGMASMITLLSTRTQMVTDLEFSVQRRLAVRNSRALLHHYFFRQGIANADNGGTVDLGAWGTIDIPSTTTSPLGSQQEFSLINFLSPGAESGFTEDVMATVRHPVAKDLSGAEFTTSYRVQVKSRSPLLAGTLLVQHKPMVEIAGIETDVQGAIEVNGNAILWKDDQLFGDVANFRVRSYDHPDQIAVSIKNLAGNNSAPTNFPFYPRCTGYTGSGPTAAPVTDGRFNMFDLETGNPTPDPLLVVNTLLNKMMTSSSPIEVDGNFNITIGAFSGDEIPDDDIPAGPDERRISIDLGNPAVAPAIVNNGVHHVKITGYSNAATGDSEPPGFVLIRSAELETITLEGNNFRRLVLGIQGNNTPIDFYVANGGATTATWRVLLTAESAGMIFNVGSGNTLTIQGGVRTDSRLAVPAGTLVLNREPNPEQLVLMDPREAWIEIYAGP